MSMTLLLNHPWQSPNDMLWTSPHTLQCDYVILLYLTDFNNSMLPAACCMSTVCPVGHSYDASAKTCTPCLQGQYGAGVGTVNTSSTFCQACTIPNMVPTALQDTCVCPPGYAWTPPATGTEASCTKCPSATYSQGPSATGCSSCPAPRTINADQTACSCPDNMELNGDGECGKSPPPDRCWHMCIR